MKIGDLGGAEGGGHVHGGGGLPIGGCESGGGTEEGTPHVYHERTQGGERSADVGLSDDGDEAAHYCGCIGEGGGIEGEKTAVTAVKGIVAHTEGQARGIGRAAEIGGLSQLEHLTVESGCRGEGDQADFVGAHITVDALGPGDIALVDAGAGGIVSTPSRAALPGPSAMVLVKPPLFCSGPSWGLPAMTLVQEAPAGQPVWMRLSTMVGVLLIRPISEPRLALSPQKTVL